MPKAKTHKGMSKRVVVTKSGIRRKAAGVSHLRVNKSDRTAVMQSVHSHDVKRIKRMLPNG